MALDYPKVLNAKVVGIKDDSDNLYIGRPNKFGNPFIIGQHGTRNEVIEMYKAWFWNNEELVKSIPELYGKNLICWCSPSKCHGDFLLDIARIYENVDSFSCEEIK